MRLVEVELSSNTLGQEEQHRLFLCQEKFQLRQKEDRLRQEEDRLHEEKFQLRQEKDRLRQKEAEHRLENKQLEATSGDLKFDFKPLGSTSIIFLRLWYLSNLNFTPLFLLHITPTHAHPVPGIGNTI